MDTHRLTPRRVFNRIRRTQMSLRSAEKHSLLNRPPYAYGLLRAADIASFFGKSETTVCEFGVAQGNGLLNMVELAQRITDETGIRFRIFGFDSGEGLTEIAGHKDHPEIWSKGDYPMFNKEELTDKLQGRAELIIGDIKDTVHGFVDSDLDPDSPLGFVSIDVDIYSSTAYALTCLLGGHELYTPAVSVYLDDASTFFSNRWCGELAAVEEFNAANELRKIDVDRTLPGSRTERGEVWFERMYVCHVLDHDARTRVDPTRRTKMTPGGHIPERVLL
jgi:hypothetical protein